MFGLRGRLKPPNETGTHRWAMVWGRESSHRHPLAGDKLDALRSMGAGLSPVDQEVVWQVLASVFPLTPLSIRAPVSGVREANLSPTAEPGTHEINIVTLPTHEVPLLRWTLWCSDGQVHVESLIGGADERVGPFQLDDVLALKIPTSAGVGACLLPFLGLLAKRGIDAQHPWLLP